MKNINLKLVALITDFKYEEDKKVYDSDYLARTIKCNGGGVLSNTQRKRLWKKKITITECLT